MDGVNDALYTERSAGDDTNYRSRVKWRQQDPEKIIKPQLNLLIKNTGLQLYNTETKLTFDAETGRGLWLS